MKTILLSLLLSAALLTTFTTCVSAQQSGDEAAVRKTLDASLTTFNKRDLTGFAALFVKSPNLYYQVYTTEGQLIMAQGWEAMTHMVGGYMKSNPKPSKTAISDYRIHINGNTAWVNATNHSEMAGQKSQSRDLLIMEKQAGNGSAPRWKIAALTSQAYTDKKLVVIK